MNTQVNLRCNEEFLKKTEEYANTHGFSTTQECIREIVREKIYEEEISQKEIALIKKLSKIIEEKNDFGSEEELFKRLQD